MVNIFLGSFYLINLILAIVAMSYDELQKKAEEEEEAALAEEEALRVRKWLGEISLSLVHTEFFLMLVLPILPATSELSGKSFKSFQFSVATLSDTLLQIGPDSSSMISMMQYQMLPDALIFISLTYETLFFPKLQ